MIKDFNDEDIRKYNEREKQRGHATKIQHTPQGAVDKMGEGSPNKPIDLAIDFGDQTLSECAKNAT